ncbi:FG-GAP-like repeat-containing protein [candidate division KSB1 bacterium]
MRKLNFMFTNRCHSSFITAAAIMLVLFTFSSADTQTPKLSAAKPNTTDSSPEITKKIYKGVQDLRIAAIRVEFQEDEYFLTSGNGLFDLSDNPDTLLIDPPPHNRTYFRDQLEAMKRYYARVSNNKLTLSYDVFPAGENDAYSLQNEMMYYNPNTTEEELDIRLSELLRDAVTAADNDVDFTQYDAVIVFHAGVGSDFLIEEAVLDPTPNDIPSVHIDSLHLAETIGEGISVEGGSYTIYSGTILPETETKRDVEIGLLGILAHQFGHELGLPSLFNTENGRPAIGKFGLMGVGFANVNGAVPAEPSAWSKVFMEWEEPYLLTDQTIAIRGPDFSVYASQRNARNRIIKIPISPSEYYLIENRIKDYAADGLNIVRAPSGVILEVDDYDVDIPGTGMLIWHVDQKVILAKLESNAINTDKDHRGVDLEEADGSQDIGELFPGILPGFPTPENGIPGDAFFTGHVTEFTPNTAPNTFSNARGNSHIYITAISDTGQVMTFNLEKDFSLDMRFPLYTESNLSGMAPIWTQPAAPESLKIIVPSANQSIFLFHGGNYTWFHNSPGQHFDTFGNRILLPTATTSNGGPYRMSAQPIFGSSDYPLEAYRNNFFFSTTKDELQIIRFVQGAIRNRKTVAMPAASHMLLADYLYMSTADKVLLVNADGSVKAETEPFGGTITGLTGMFTQSGAEVYATLADGTVIKVNSDGTSLAATLSMSSDSAMSILSDLDNSGVVELITIGSNGNLSILGDESNTNSVDAVFVFEPVAGDIDGDGYREVIVAAQSGDTYPEFQLYAFEKNGSFVEGFPIRISEFGYPDWISTNIILGDITGDGKQNILFGTDRGNLFALNEYGEPVDGFPLPTADAVTGTPLLLRNTVEDRMELAAFDDAGYFYLWDLERSYDDKVLAWPAYGGGNAHLRFNTESLDAVLTPPEDQLMPPEKVYNWPNPNIENWTKIRYYLHHDADVKIRIFNQVGDLAAEFDGLGLALLDNEVTWDLTNVQSGIYYAEVAASGNGLIEKKVIKIAVIK